jgi:DNA-binding CsgD family transcriptional regulator
MLWSRTPETSAIDRLLSRARAGQGGGLLFRGEPGIGKSALLKYAREQAADLCVLEAAGAVAESDLAYATMHQLLGPLLPRMDGLPGPQGAALRISLGLQAERDAPDPFLVSLAALTLLSDAGQPVLCLVDDVQWVDGPSAGVLAFVVRRLRAEPIVVLAAGRLAPDRGPADFLSRTDLDLAQTGLPERILSRLGPDEASALLTERCDVTLPASVRDALLTAAAGHPLALIELPGILSPAQLAGTEPLPEPLPLAGELERVFAARVSQLEPGLRTLALLCACSGQLPAITQAAAALGVDAAGLDRLHGLVRIEARAVAFAHPLIRSAVYYQASPAERRAAHAALADREEADRRAWHLSRAASGPDENVAAELERSANRTLRRSGYAAAAAAFERAAELSPADTARARRLAAAADAAWHAADTARVRALLAAAEQLPLPEPALRLRLRHLHGLIELRSGVPADGLAILLPAAAEAVKTDPHLAVAMLAEAGECAFQAGDEGAAREIAALLAVLPDSGDPRDALLAGLYRSVGAEPGGEAPTPSGLSDLEELDDPDLLARAGGMLHGLGQPALARRLRLKAVARARALGAAGTLAWALRSLALDEIDYGRFAWAGAYAAEGLQLALEAGQPNLACQHRAFLAEIAAVRGPEAEGRRLSHEVLAEATGRGLRGTVALARRALIQLALATGRPDEALVQLEAMWTLGAVVHRGLARHSVPDLVEAAVRAGRPELGAERLPRYLSWAEAAGSAEAGALAARSRALLAGPDEADALFEESLRLHAVTDQPMQQARTALLYGEHLRRHRRRVDARGYLHLAADAFERLGAACWAQRARDELRATGETVRKRRGEGQDIDRLTHQELQVARAVSQGLTNREAAAQLFISPRTVDHHLRGIYRKFGITSRAELVLLAEELAES